MTRFFRHEILVALAVVASLGFGLAGHGVALAAPTRAHKPFSSTGSSFVHTATAANSVGDYTILNERNANTSPQDLYQVTATWDTNQACGCVYDTHALGVWYTGSNWAIFHQDGTAIPVGATYNVIGVPASTYSDGNLYLHTATAANSGGDWTALDDAFINNDPHAVIVVTQDWNANGACGCVYNNHQIGVWYNGSRWAIFNEDGTAIPAGAAFNVEVFTAPDASIGVLTQQATTSSYITTINSSASNGNAAKLLFVTPNWNVNGTCGCVFSNHPIGVYYNGSQWTIYNQDIAAMPIGAAFNVFAIN